MTRRNIRVDSQFFVELDDQLGESRGPNGEPSASDFLLIELPTISDAFAEHFDEFLAVYPDRDDYRYLVVAGKLFKAALVVGQLMADGSVVLISIDIDRV